MFLKDLPKSHALLCLEIEQNIRNFIPNIENKKLLLAYSGGIDSRALLQILIILAPRLKFNIGIAHCNHNLRPEAEAEAGFAHQIAKEFNLEFHHISCDIRKKAQNSHIGIEECARNFRYEFFEKCIEIGKFDFVVLAHQLNDLGEDIIMRLLRGSGWPAVAGMQAFDFDRKILRPLLNIEKSRLNKFLLDMKINWQEDESNKELHTLRNRIRHKIIPLLLLENPNFLQSAHNLWLQAQVDRNFWDTYIKKSENSNNLMADLMLRKIHQAERLRLYKAKLNSMGKNQVRSSKLFELDTAFVAKKTGKSFQFSGDKLATITSQGIYFSFIDRAKI